MAENNLLCSSVFFSVWITSLVKLCFGQWRISHKKFIPLCSVLNSTTLHIFYLWTEENFPMFNWTTGNVFCFRQVPSVCLIFLIRLEIRYGKQECYAYQPFLMDKGKHYILPCSCGIKQRNWAFESFFKKKQIRLMYTSHVLYIQKNMCQRL